MLNSLIWVIAIIVLNGVVASLAKKAQAKAEAARQSGAAGAAQPQAPAAPPPDAARQPGRKGPKVLARGGSGDGSGSGPRIDRSGRGRSGKPAGPAPSTKPTVTKRPPAPVQDARQPSVASRPPSPPPVAPRGGAVGGSAVSAAVGQRGGDSAGALLSRQHLVDSVARVRAAEAKISGLPNVEIVPATARSAARPNRQAADLAAMLRDPAQVRRAFVLGEVLGRPRADRPN